MRRRYSDFEWLRNELERDSKVSQVKLNLESDGITPKHFHYLVDCGATAAGKSLEATNAFPRRRGII